MLEGQLQQLRQRCREEREAWHYDRWLSIDKFTTVRVQPSLAVTSQQWPKTPRQHSTAEHAQCSHSKTGASVQLTMLRKVAKREAAGAQEAAEAAKAAAVARPQSQPGGRAPLSEQLQVDRPPPPTGRNPLFSVIDLATYRVEGLKIPKAVVCLLLSDSAFLASPGFDHWVFP